MSVSLVSPDPSAFVTYISKPLSRLELNAIFAPKGDQSGSKSSAGLLVSRVCPVPAAFITYISSLPSREDMNAIFAPSGDQAGSESKAGLLVSLVCPVPSAFITYISELLSRPDTNAIFAPLGDQAGTRSRAGFSVSRVCPEPSGFITYISSLPSRLELNAIFVPSGDQAGSDSRAGLLVSRVCPVPSAFITYISVSPSRRDTNAIWPDRADPGGAAMAKGRAGASRVSGVEMVGVTSITPPTSSPSPEHAVAMPIANTRTANVPPARAHRRARDRCHALAHTVIQVTDGRHGVRVSRVAGRGGGVGVRRGVAGCCCGGGSQRGEITGRGRPGAPARGACATSAVLWRRRHGPWAMDRSTASSSLRVGSLRNSLNRRDCSSIFCRTTARGVSPSKGTALGSIWYRPISRSMARSTT